jgi:hypothetical protein
VRIDISLDDVSLGAVQPPPAERDRPTPRGLALALVFLVLLGFVAVHARRLTHVDIPAANYDVPPPVTSAVVRSGRGYFLLNLSAHEFTYVIPLINASTWPVTVTELRVDLPNGLRAVGLPRVLDIPPPGRSPAQLSIPIELPPSLPVQVILQLAVACERLATIQAVPARVLVAATIGDRAGEVDLMADLVIFGQTWSANLAGSLCDQSATNRSTPPTGW